MGQYVNRIRTEAGDLQINYEALANLPQSDKTLSKDGAFADAKATSDAIKQATIIVDNTLANEGQAADAKTVGTQFQNIEESISDINGEVAAVQITAGNALPKSGGNMSGNINMSGNKISGISDPVDNSDVVNKKYVVDYVDNKHFIATVTINASAWVGSVAPYTQEVSLDGILESDNPHYGVIYSGTKDNKISQKEAFSYVDELATANGKLTFTCLDDKPAVDLNIQLEVNR